MRDAFYRSCLSGIGIIGSFEVATQPADVSASWAVAFVLAGGLIAAFAVAGHVACVGRNRTSTTKGGHANHDSRKRTASEADKD